MFTKRTPPSIERARRPLPPTQRTTQVFSYYANRDPRAGAASRDVKEVPTPARRGPRFPWLQRLPQLIVAGVVVLLVLLSLRLDSTARIEVVESGQGKVFLRDTDVYAQAVHKALSRPMNSTKISVDTASISSDLLRQFPELAAVSVSLPFIGNQPVVFIQPADPKLIVATKDGGLFVLDRDGRALMAGTQAASLRKLDVPIVQDQSGLPISAGKIALPRATVAFIETVAYQLKAKGIKVTSYALPAGTYELHVQPEGVGYYVKFNVYGVAREEAGAFIALKQNLEAKHKQPAEYIDVRVEGRAYYK